MANLVPKHKYILVPYDGSKPASKSLDHDVNIARSVGGNKSDVILLNVVS